jgi:ApbE superfamily uncharacterized protein (UPF0280 family)
MNFQPRTYRKKVQKKGLVAFRVVVQETDLHIQADCDYETFARERILYHRGILEKYIARNPAFATTMVPWPGDAPKPILVQEMVRAGRRAGVGPMAAVAGAIAEAIGTDLLGKSEEVIVENGGDVFVTSREPVTISIDAGESAMGDRIGVRAGGGGSPLGICTSSGIIGHSHSYGRADAVCVISPSCAMADAAATAICNRVETAQDIRSAIEWGQTIPDILGIVIIIGGKMGAWGEVALVPLEGKKG